MVRSCLCCSLIRNVYSGLTNAVEWKMQQSFRIVVSLCKWTFYLYYIVQFIHNQLIEVGLCIFEWTKKFLVTFSWQFGSYILHGTCVSVSTCVKSMCNNFTNVLNTPLKSWQCIKKWIKCGNFLCLLTIFLLTINSNCRNFYKKNCIKFDSMNVNIQYHKINTSIVRYNFYCMKIHWNRYQRIGDFNLTVIALLFWSKISNCNQLFINSPVLWYNLL